MPALKHDVEIEQGATFQREFTVTDLATGAAFDFTGYAVTAELKTLAGVKVADFSIAITANKVLIELPEAVSLTIAATVSFSHRYTVYAAKADAPDYRIAQGKVLISAK